ncbi:YfjI family protein [Stenotrophomonas sp. UBA7606]|uniref:YfjI family protein n=1 Tax=Stenotrophomonas sp. UBA7606 TaxID=1947559 RepID=UPI0025D38802|nr:YfjI family protein [Stenotrophomonas sp. UBA7606]
MTKHIPPFAFPVNEFYKPVALAIEETMETIQAPDALVATSFLTGMSIACQSDVDVMLPYGATTPCALYLATVAESGERKTATDKLVMKPIYDYELSYVNVYKAAAEQYEVDHGFWEIESKAINRLITSTIAKGDDTAELRERFAVHKAAEPVKPECTRIIVQDATERGLINAVQGDGKSIAMLSDEGATLLKSGAFRNSATLNKLWDAPSLLMLDRADEVVQVTDPRLTLSFMIQEQLLQDFLRTKNSAARASGFLARFLFCHPESTQGYRAAKELTDENTVHGTNVLAFHTRMTQLLEARDQRHADGNCSKKVLRFSTDAKALWKDTYDIIEPELAKGGAYHSIRDAASKTMEIASRIAGIFHHFEGIEGDVIERATLQRAINIALFYQEEFVEKFGDHNDLPEDEKDARSLMEYMRTKYWIRCRDWAYRNDVRKCGPVRHQGRFAAALELLVEDNAIRVVPERRSGRTSKLIIEFNPSVFGRTGAL